MAWRHKSVDDLTLKRLNLHAFKHVNWFGIHQTDRPKQRNLFTSFQEWNLIIRSSFSTCFCYVTVARGKLPKTTLPKGYLLLVACLFCQDNYGSCSWITACIIRRSLRRLNEELRTPCPHIRSRTQSTARGRGAGMSTGRTKLECEFCWCVMFLSLLPVRGILCK